LTHKRPDFPLPDDAREEAAGYMLDQDYALVTGERNISSFGLFNKQTHHSKNHFGCQRKILPLRGVDALFLLIFCDNENCQNSTPV
jgi:hypothetical protein